MSCSASVPITVSAKSGSGRSESQGIDALDIKKIHAPAVRRAPGRGLP